VSPQVVERQSDAVGVVAHDALPPDFAKIPEGHPRGAVLASVAGTPQAREALIDNNIPQTAEVSRTATTYRATYEGAPRFESIEGTPLHDAVNSPVPVIQVDPKTYYALEDGVSFTGASPNGPWSVATTVPAVIYTIAPSSPLHYVTYVRVYSATPQAVTVGYTPGYYGTVVAPNNVVVYPRVYVGRTGPPRPTPTATARDSAGALSRASGSASASAPVRRQSRAWCSMYTRPRALMSFTRR
jgi:hypothetical protein